MANENRISVVITADPTGAITGIRMVGDETEKLGGRTQSLTQRLKSHWAEVSVGIYAAVKAFQSIWGLMEKAAETDEAMASLDALTRQYGMTAQDLVGRIEQESKGLIGMGAAAKVAGDALMKGLGPEQLAQIASWSVSLSHIKAGTVSTADAFEMLSQSIATGRERGLKALVGIVDLEQKYGKYADTMSKAEKAQAMYTVVAERMGQVQATLGPDLDSAADRMERFNNSVERMKYFLGSLLLIIGQPFMAVFQVAMTLVYGLAGAFDTLVTTGAMVTDWLNVTEGATERWAKKADTAYGNAARSAVDAFENIKGALASLGDMGKAGGGVPLPTLGGDGNRKQLEQLAELYRKYIEEKDIASASEYDREFIRLNKWFEDEKQKLNDLHAAKIHYDAMYADYSAKWDEAEIARALKISTIELKMHEETQKRKLESAQAIGKAELDAQEQRIRAGQELSAAAVKSGYTTEMEGISEKAASERTILEIQRQRNWLAMEALSIEGEFVGTYAQLLEILGKEAVLQDQIVASKAMEAFDLSARRVEVEGKIADLLREQRDLLFEQQAARTQEAFSKIGGSEFGQNLGVVSAINAGEDPYTKDFERWSALQDQKIMYLEEIGASEQQIKDAYREYDLQQEATAQAQKVAMTAATFGMLGSLANSLYVMQGQKGGAAFEMMKAFRIGETIMNTYSAAVGAYNALAGIPIVGPFLGAAAAAAAIAFGMMQVNAIRSMKPGGGASASVAGSVGAGSAPSIPAAPETASATQETVRSPTVNVHIYGNVVDHDKFARELVPAITKAIGDGVA
ncbi:MAG: hypothetical protein D4R80_00655 [Deltaproteobacteria bacterium]|nr:MAG: hypothetical protein D4R80_00655 [Deltaproteobacteria bacterium]